MNIVQKDFPPKQPEYSDYSIRNKNMAIKGFEFLFGEVPKFDLSKFDLSLGRGNVKNIEGKKLTFFNPHNLDAHGVPFIL